MLVLLKASITCENTPENPSEPHAWICTRSILAVLTCSSSVSCIDCRVRHHRLLLCSFQMIALLIKHNLLTISALSAAPLALTRTRPHPSSPFPGSPQPRACCQGNRHLISEVSVCIIVFTLSSNNLSPLSLSGLFVCRFCANTHTHTHTCSTHTFYLSACSVLLLWPLALSPLDFFFF